MEQFSKYELQNIYKVMTIEEIKEMKKRMDENYKKDNEYIKSSFSYLKTEPSHEKLGREIQKILKSRSNFLDERKPLHITFIYYGHEKGSPAMFKDLSDEIDKLPEQYKTLTTDVCDVFHTRSGELLVLKFKCSPELQQLQKSLREKWGVKDHIQIYNPHMTLGKYRGEGLPDVEKMEFKITGVSFK